MWLKSDKSSKINDFDAIEGDYRAFEGIMRGELIGIF
jgi:hypothetical protein